MVNKTGGKVLLKANKKITQRGNGRKTVKLAVNRRTKLRVRKT